jgi:DNA-binding CsgD family transcriptional regulator
LVHRQLWADPETRKQFERAVTRSGRVDAFEARLRCKEGCEIGALVSAEIVTIGGESCVLCAFQDISSRKRNEAELMQAIEAVMSDASWFSRAVVEKLAALRAPARFGSPAEPAPSAGDMTPRERDVLARMCRGQDDPTIAAELGVSRNTVRNHVAALFRKLGVNRRSAAIIWARDRGFGEEAAPRRLPRLVPMHYHDQSFGTIDHDLSGLIQDATAGA